MKWIQSLCAELGLFLKNSPVLLCDNVGAVYLTANPVFHSRMKHVEIDFHFICEKVFMKDLQIRFVSTKEQVANFLTKALTKASFLKLKAKLHILPSPCV